MTLTRVEVGERVFGERSLVWQEDLDDSQWSNASGAACHGVSRKSNRFVRRCQDLALQPSVVEEEVSSHPPRDSVEVADDGGTARPSVLDVESP